MCAWSLPTWLHIHTLHRISTRDYTCIHCITLTHFIPHLHTCWSKVNELCGYVIKWRNLEIFLALDFGSGNRTRCAWPGVDIPTGRLKCHRIKWHFSLPVGISTPGQAHRVRFPEPKSRDKNVSRLHHQVCTWNLWMYAWYSYTALHIHTLHHMCTLHHPCIRSITFSHNTFTHVVIDTLRGLVNEKQNPHSINPLKLDVGGCFRNEKSNPPNLNGPDLSVPNLVQVRVKDPYDALSLYVIFCKRALQLVDALSL